MNDEEPVVEWVEPFGPSSGPIISRISIADAIAHQKRAADKQKPGFRYDSDRQALEDFMIVHWASLVHVSTTKVDPESYLANAANLKANTPIFFGDPYHDTNQPERGPDWP